MDHEVAVKALGPDLAQNLRSLVADMREAMYLGELADLPEIVMDDDSVKLRFLLGPRTWLEAEPTGNVAKADNGWRQSHRVKLIHIHRNGTISA